MAIKMRVRKDNKGICKACKCEAKEVLDMFDICFGDEIITVCDECVNALFTKTLKASNYTNGRLKSQHDIAVKNARNSKKFKPEYRSLND